MSEQRQQQHHNHQLQPLSPSANSLKLTEDSLPRKKFPLPLSQRASPFQDIRSAPQRDRRNRSGEREDRFARKGHDRERDFYRDDIPTGPASFSSIPSSRPLLRRPQTPDYNETDRDRTTGLPPYPGNPNNNNAVGSSFHDQKPTNGSLGNSSTPAPRDAKLDGGYSEPPRAPKYGINLNNIRDSRYRPGPKSAGRYHGTGPTGDGNHSPGYGSSTVDFGSGTGRYPADEWNRRRSIERDRWERDRDGSQSAGYQSDAYDREYYQHRPRLSQHHNPIPPSVANREHFSRREGGGQVSPIAYWDDPPRGGDYRLGRSAIMRAPVVSRYDLDGPAITNRNDDDAPERRDYRAGGGTVRERERERERDRDGWDREVRDREPFNGRTVRDFRRYRADLSPPPLPMDDETWERKRRPLIVDVNAASSDRNVPAPSISSPVKSDTHSDGFDVAKKRKRLWNRREEDLKEAGAEEPIANIGTKSNSEPRHTLERQPDASFPGRRTNSDTGFMSRDGQGEKGIHEGENGVDEEKDDELTPEKIMAQMDRMDADIAEQEELLRRIRQQKKATWEKMAKKPEEGRSRKSGDTSRRFEVSTGSSEKPEQNMCNDGTVAVEAKGENGSLPGPGLNANDVENTNAFLKQKADFKGKSDENDAHGEDDEIETDDQREEDQADDNDAESVDDKAEDYVLDQFCRNLYDENHARAKRYGKPIRPLPSFPVPPNSGGIFSFSDFDFWEENNKSHEKLRPLLVQYLYQQNMAVAEKEARLSQQYRDLHREWHKQTLKLDKLKKRKAKKGALSLDHLLSTFNNDVPLNPSSVGSYEHVSPLPARSNRRNERSLASGDYVSSEAALLQVLELLTDQDGRDPNIRASKTSAIVPPMILHRQDRCAAFDDRTRLIINPCEYYQISSALDNWTEEEKSAYLRKYAAYPKQFGKIAREVKTKTASECVLFYYREKKSINFKALSGKDGKRKKKLGMPSTVAGKLKEQQQEQQSSLQAQQREKEREKEARRKKAEDQNSNRNSNSNKDGRQPQLLNRQKESAEGRRRTRLDVVGGEESETRSPTMDPPTPAKSRGTRAGRRTAAAVPTPPPASEADEEPDNAETEEAMKGDADAGREIELDTKDADLNDAMMGDESPSSEFSDSSPPPVTNKWTEDECHMAVVAFRIMGKDFESVALLIKTKNADQCRNFYFNYRRKFGDAALGLDAGENGGEDTAEPASSGRKPRRGGKRGGRRKRGKEEMDEETNEADDVSSVFEDGGLGGDAERDAVEALEAFEKAETEAAKAPMTSNSSTAKRTRKRRTKEQTAPPTSDISKTPEATGINTLNNNPTFKSNTIGILNGNANISSETTATPAPAPSEPTFRKDRRYKDNTGSAEGSGPPKRSTTSSYWSVHEKQDFIKYLAMYGKNFEAISRGIKSKSAVQAKNYYTSNLVKLDLEQVVEMHAANNAGTAVPEKADNASDVGAYDAAGMMNFSTSLPGVASILGAPSMLRRTLPINNQGIPGNLQHLTHLPSVSPMHRGSITKIGSLLNAEMDEDDRPKRNPLEDWFGSTGVIRSATEHSTASTLDGNETEDEEPPRVLPQCSQAPVPMLAGPVFATIPPSDGGSAVAAQMHPPPFTASPQHLSLGLLDYQQQQQHVQSGPLHGMFTAPPPPPAQHHIPDHPRIATATTTTPTSAISGEPVMYRISEVIGGGLIYRRSSVSASATGGGGMIPYEITSLPALVSPLFPISSLPGVNTIISGPQIPQPQPTQHQAVPIPPPPPPPPPPPSQPPLIARLPEVGHFTPSPGIGSTGVVVGQQPPPPPPPPTPPLGFTTPLFTPVHSPHLPTTTTTTTSFVPNEITDSITEAIPTTPERLAVSTGSEPNISTQTDLRAV